MAPTIQTADTQNGTVTSNTQTWTLTYPTNLASGDLIFAFVGRDGGTGSAQWSSAGFTGGVTTQASGACTLAFGARFSDGTQTGNFSLDVGASEQGGWRVFRITSVEQSTIDVGLLAGGPVECRTPGGSTAAASGTSDVPDPPECNPIDWDVEDTLWLAACAADTSRTISVWPLADNQTADVSGGAGGGTLGLCTVTSAVASLDPGTFTISASDQWEAATIAIRPAAAAVANPYPFVGGGYYPSEG